MSIKVELTWVDVNDELPKDGNIVLGLTCDNLIIPTCFHQNKHSGKKWFEWFESGDKARIVFWTKEPETPKLEDRVKAYNKFYGNL